MPIKRKAQDVPHTPHCEKCGVDLTRVKELEAEHEQAMAFVSIATGIRSDVSDWPVELDAKIGFVQTLFHYIGDLRNRVDAAEMRHETNFDWEYD